MSSVVLSGDTSGTITVSAPAVAGSSVQTLAAVTGTLAPIVSGTIVNATSTSVEFTGIPSWVKRITIGFTNLSTNGGSPVQVQLGSGSYTTSGYLGSIQYGGASIANLTSGFKTEDAGTASYARNGVITLSFIGLNTWCGSINSGLSNQTAAFHGGGSVSLSGTLDRLRITTVNGTDTFDAGSINILYE